MSLAYALDAVTYEYRSFTHILNTEDNLSYLAYGIEVYRHDFTGCEKLDCIHGITTRIEKMNRLLERLNHAQVSPCHFRDVVEDFLS